MVSLFMNPERLELTMFFILTHILNYMGIYGVSRIIINFNFFVKLLCYSP
ncbi:Uncharacterised protein [Streptococcus pneumoniae]|nr:hypothetical protein FORC13_3925 [Bacillus cereus]CEY39749.1 Uncharacterised protein [Streptococcus pneumoniae]AQQ62007.1 hypothetical Protein FORC21_1212 [Bacillus cereus]CGF85635.1 Uncharacterised protein [Streptococcus pneumoniae]CJA83360.1 Uncharacterised protein [Streptococcus pneumoniae]